MIILDKDLKLDRGDTLTHKRYPFTLDKNYQKIRIKMTYSPTRVPENERIEILKECIDKYMPKGEFSKKEREDTLKSQIENFITTSLFYEGNFIGAYHNKNNEQEIIISPKKSSLGYKKTDIKAGAYEFVLSMHSCNSKVNCKFSLEALDE
ncbi:hypothetical protein [Anaerococcus nagyae]|uniref:hypothetical protein n=1 Tax=Anaerococcus nagyae TaxID=1755241 RepID=UPI003735873F